MKPNANSESWTAPARRLDLKQFISVAAFVFTLGALVTPGFAADVTVVHGIPGDGGLPVDVRFGGDCVLADVPFTAIGGPLSIDVDFYPVEVLLADAGADCQGVRVIRSFAPVTLDESTTVVAHLTTAASFTLSQFPDDLRNPGSDTRVVVRHTADAPKVDVWVRPVGGEASPLFTDLANGFQEQAIVAPGDYDVGLAPAGELAFAFGPVTLGLSAGTTNFVYAVGSLSEGTFDLIVETR